MRCSFRARAASHWSLDGATGIAAVSVAAPDQDPAGMGLTADIGLRGIMLGIKRVEVLLEPMLARHAGVACRKRAGR
jgi:hypothetical protein